MKISKEVDIQLKYQGESIFSVTTMEYEFFDVEKDSIEGKHDKNDLKVLQVTHYTTHEKEVNGKCPC